MIEKLAARSDEVTDTPSELPDPPAASLGQGGDSSFPSSSNMIVPSSSSTPHCSSSAPTIRAAPKTTSKLTKVSIYDKKITFDLQFLLTTSFYFFNVLVFQKKIALRLCVSVFSFVTRENFQILLVFLIHRNELAEGWNRSLPKEEP